MQKETKKKKKKIKSKTHVLTVITEAFTWNVY